jgi:hypothetical protein
VLSCQQSAKGRMGSGVSKSRIEPISGQYLDNQTCQQLCGAQFDQSLSPLLSSLSASLTLLFCL